MEVALIVDGNQKMGMGNIVRGITLAEELQSRAGIVFLTRSDKVVVNQIQDRGFNVHRLDRDKEIVALLCEIKPSVVVIDRRNVPRSLAKNLKDALDVRTTIFDNTSTANDYADVVVNGVMGDGYRNTTRLDKETGTLYFYGLKYEVLRKEFYKYRKSPDRRPCVPEKILLLFGGSDPSNLTTVVLGELLKSHKDYDIDIILGVNFGYSKELATELAKYPDKKDRVKIHKNIKGVARVMYKSDLVVSSPGLSVFEALRVGVSVIPICQNEAQMLWFSKFLPTLDKSEVWKLNRIIEKREYADPFGAYVRELEVGEGKNEVIAALMEGREG